MAKYCALLLQVMHLGARWYGMAELQQLNVFFTTSLLLRISCLRKEFKDTAFTDGLVYLIFYIEEMRQSILKSSILPLVLVLLLITPQSNAAISLWFTGATYKYYSSWKKKKRLLKTIITKEKNYYRGQCTQIRF